MDKSARIDAFVQSLGFDPAGEYHPCYLGYFACFNAGDYYEAHDVLEHLWLDEPGDDALFYQGLIQLAGAFVHMKKQRERPWHAKDGRRLAPAARLLALAEKNLAPYAPHHLGCDVDALCRWMAELRSGIAGSEYRENPWSPESRPRLDLTPRDA